MRDMQNWSIIKSQELVCTVQCILDKYGRFYKDNDMKDMHNVRYRLGPKGNILDYLTVA